MKQTAAMGLGTVQFGMEYGVANNSGRPMLAEVREILNCAQAGGFEFLDTAIAYGESEKILGEVGIPNWKVVSKLPSIPDDQYDIIGWMTDQIEGSLKKLGLSQLYGLLLHDPLQLHGPRAKNISLALEKISERKLVKRIGVSIQDPGYDLPVVLQYMHPTLIQAPFNFLQNDLVADGWSEQLQSLDCEVHTRSAFLQGLLLMEAESRPSCFSVWSEHWQAWELWLKVNGLTPQKACLNFVRTQPSIDCCIVGVDSVKQLRELLDIPVAPILSFPSWPRTEAADLINPSRWSKL